MSLSDSFRIDYSIGKHDDVGMPFSLLFKPTAKVQFICLPLSLALLIGAWCPARGLADEPCMGAYSSQGELLNGIIILCNETCDSGLRLLGCKRLWRERAHCEWLCVEKGAYSHAA